MLCSTHYPIHTIFPAPCLLLHHNPFLQSRSFSHTDYSALSFLWKTFSQLAGSSASQLTSIFRESYLCSTAETEGGRYVFPASPTAMAWTHVSGSINHMYPSQTLKQDPVTPQRETSSCSNWVFSRLNPPDRNAVIEGKEFSAVASPTAPALDGDADLCFCLHKQYFPCKTLFLLKSTQTNAWNVQLRVVSVLSVFTEPMQSFHQRQTSEHGRQSLINWCWSSSHA